MPFNPPHKTICQVLEELRTLIDIKMSYDKYIKASELIDEAKDYAQRMSAKLVEYKHHAERSEGN